MRSRLMGVLTLAALALIAAVVPAQAGTAVAADGASAPYCGITWGSLDKLVRGSPLLSGPTTVTNVRAGRHDCYDRVVIDLSGPPADIDVRYVTEVRSDGSGDLVPLRGGAFLEVFVTAPAYDSDYRPTFRPANPTELVEVAGWRTLRQVAWAGSFEGNSTIGVGVRARLPFRVFALAGPGSGSRLVIDIAHRW